MSLDGLIILFMRCTPYITNSKPDYITRIIYREKQRARSKAIERNAQTLGLTEQTLPIFWTAYLLDLATKFIDTL